VTDSTGVPVANAAVTLAAVDEGICALTNFCNCLPFPRRHPFHGAAAHWVRSMSLIA